ncbi:hypothetical protein DCC81_20130 [Chitinophaga parva]|uniref:Uncharacterized protein n=1 Tax=Chitinophaga parva TaxID=2169414 RepID=A0A2T7BCE8_9BACT|nr:hypothetical protein [Chitinophaga parva]PUZ22742.1 hypothetical protein DCC81_20130 [Chitinophaga parva]
MPKWSRPTRATGSAWKARRLHAQAGLSIRFFRQNTDQHLLVDLQAKRNRHRQRTAYRHLPASSDAGIQTVAM